MLKKAGIAVAVAAAGVLALAPFALADDENQTSTQTIDQGEGKANGKNLLSGMAEQLICGKNFTDAGTSDAGNNCASSGSEQGQIEKQTQRED
ncbi:MAG: hypothetical protein ACT4RN_03040 [Pseudonocardia sp.]